MRTHDQVVAELMNRPGVRQEVERIEREEGALLDLLLKARHDAGLTQAQVAERMGTQPPAVMGVTPPRMNDLFRGRLSRFSLDALVNIAAKLG